MIGLKIDSIKLPPLQVPILNSEPIYYPITYTLNGSRIRSFEMPKGIEQIIFTRINAFFPNIKGSGTLPANFEYPKISLYSTLQVYMEDIDMRTFISRIDGQQWVGGIGGLNIFIGGTEGFNVEVSNFNNVATPTLKIVLIGRRILKESAYAGLSA